MFSGAYKFYIGYELIRYVKFIMYNYALVKRTHLLTKSINLFYIDLMCWLKYNKNVSTANEKYYNENMTTPLHKTNNQRVD